MCMINRFIILTKIRMYLNFIKEIDLHRARVNDHSNLRKLLQVSRTMKYPTATCHMYWPLSSLTIHYALTRVCTEQNYNSISPSHSLPNEGEEYPFEKIPLGDTLRLFVANWQHAKAILNSFS